MRFQTNVRGYTDTQLINRGAEVSEMDSKRSKNLPLLIVVSSMENAFNDFDDKAYLYKADGSFHSVTSCTANPGSTALKYFIKWNPKGAAVLKTNEFYVKGLKFGQMRGMDCLRQNTAFWTYRDGNKDDVADELGEPVLGVYGTHYHGIDFSNNPLKTARKVNGWSAGCMVGNEMEEYNRQIYYVEDFEYCDLLILKEWET